MTWNYLAGFFDGEGCIHYAARSYGRYVHVHVSQGVVNERQSQIILRVHRHLRSHGIYPRLSFYPGGLKCVVTNCQGTIAWLSAMQPYLIVKREMASSAIDFARQMASRRRIQRKFTALDWEDIYLDKIHISERTSA